MSMQESKLTARIDTALYEKVKGNFHHGQQTQFFRQIFVSLGQLIDEGKASEITDYLYNHKLLTLPRSVKVED